MPDACEECGARVSGGTSGCHALMETLTARASSDAAVVALHRKVVDAYALQHPSRHCRSAKSLAAHLTGLCCALEHDANPTVYAAVQRWLNGLHALERPNPPSSYGPITIAALPPETMFTDGGAAIDAWARSVWDAWRVHHETGRRWLLAAVGAAAPSGGNDS